MTASVSKARQPATKLPTFETMLGDLVRTPSVSCTNDHYDRSNIDVINYLANWLEDLGMSTQVQSLPGSNAGHPGKANLIATAGPANTDDPNGASEGLVLAGHSDTVPCNESQWQREPFALATADDRFYGLGACDMKGFFPVAIEAIARHDLRRLKRPITLIATADEESSMAGARLLSEQRSVGARACVVGEPTGLQPIYAHKGIMMMSITLQGASGHSSNPALGCNALDAMHAVMTELIAFRKELATKWQNPGFDVQVPTLNLGCMHAGDNPNRICDHAELQIDLRLLPGMNIADTFADLKNRINVVAERCGTPLTVQSFTDVPAFETAKDADLVNYLESTTGRSAGTVAYGTEGPFFNSLGMETVIFGPGSIDQAHQPNEYLAHDQIEPAVDVLAGLINHYCN